MKIKLLVAAMIAGVAMLSQAQTAAPAAKASESKTRAEVKAEAKAANKAGEIPLGAGPSGPNANGPGAMPGDGTKK